MITSIVACHIKDVRQGDTIMHDGAMRTVSGNNIKRCPFMGVKLFGDSYELGTKPVQRVIIHKAIP
jgi:hypothetical protein